MKDGEAWTKVEVVELRGSRGFEKCNVCRAPEDCNSVIKEKKIKQEG